MDAFLSLITYTLPFLIVLSVLVFVHEMGHYWVARRCGVRVEVFSIGFGPELFGRTDHLGTRWKLSAIPLGGYVRMFGEMDPTQSVTEAEAADAQLSPEEKRVSFRHQPVGNRMAIVFAGPAANFLFALVVLAGLFSTYGQPFTPADVGAVQPGSAAEQAGLRVGDVITAIDGSSVVRFEEVQQVVRLNAGRRLHLEVKRGEDTLDLYATPTAHALTDRFGNSHAVGLLGISRAGMEYQRHGPFTALWQAMRESGLVISGTFTALGQMVMGERGTADLGGPLRIAQMSGEMAQSGLEATVWFLAMLSINLGLLNLFPVPLLDGGHLLFYLVEAVRGRPLAERTQEYGFRIGLALVLTLMVFATWNDLVHLRVVAFLRGLIS